MTELVPPPLSEAALADIVAQRIGSLRRALGLSFDGLAQRAGVAKGTLVQIEGRRANPSISTLCRLAAALGVSVADLCRKHGVSDASIYKWKAKFGGMDVSEAKRLKALEEENRKLKKGKGGK